MRYYLSFVLFATTTFFISAVTVAGDLASLPTRITGDLSTPEAVCEDARKRSHDKSSSDFGKQHALVFKGVHYCDIGKQSCIGWLHTFRHLGWINDRFITYRTQLYSDGKEIVPDRDRAQWEVEGASSNLLLFDLKTCTLEPVESASGSKVDVRLAVLSAKDSTLETCLKARADSVSDEEWGRLIYQVQYYLGTHIRVQTLGLELGMDDLSQFDSNSALGAGLCWYISGEHPLSNTKQEIKEALADQ